MPIYVPVNTITMRNTTYEGCTNILSVNLDNISGLNNDMTNAFTNCSNLTAVNNINNSITTLQNAFDNCKRLYNIPTLPTAVTNMISTFADCVNLRVSPPLSENVTNMRWTYSSCINLQSIPTIPNSVVDMHATFKECRNVNSDCILPNSITDVSECFNNCVNYNSTVNILSQQVTNATDIFANTTKDKDVYIPYYRYYTNRVNSTTRNTFTTLGYTETGTKEGVHLKNNTPTLTINANPADATITFTANGHSLTAKSISVPAHTQVSYTIEKEGYVTKTGTVTVNTEDITLDVRLIISLYATPGDYTVFIEAGAHEIIIRGAGGSGGTSGNSGVPGGAGGAGGAGAPGKVIAVPVNFDTDTYIDIHVGAEGKTKANGGNGGNGGSGGGQWTGGAGGAGGGAGEPSYAVINGVYYVADGGAGGGGGGGGGTNHGQKASRGAGGGGGGGLYKFIDNVITSIDGKKGADQTSGWGAGGTAGNTDDYPDLRSGSGGTGYSNGGAGWINIGGGSGAAGGGASGASGGGWGSYSSGGSEGGGGGGGCGGSDEAGGGGSSYRGGAAASNHYTTPTDVLAVNQSYGVNDTYGQGGTSNTNGRNGYVKIN